MGSSIDIYVPTEADIERIIKDVIEAAENAVEPMFMIHSLGHPYFIDLGGGHDTEHHPWLFGYGTFFACNESGRIHWMHPDIRKALDTITEPLLREAIARGQQYNPEKTPAQIAETFMGWCQESLAELDVRMKTACAFYDAVSEMGRYTDTFAARADFSRLCAKHEIDEGVGRAIAKCALHLDLSEFIGPTTARGDGQAALLSRFIDPKRSTSPCPSLAKKALARLHEAGHKAASQEDIDYVATAVAHGLFQENLIAEQCTPSGAVALLHLKIEKGMFDNDDCEAGFYSLERRIGELIAGAFPAREAISAHQSIELIGAANARMRAVGRAPITPQRCRQAIEQDATIPF